MLNITERLEAKEQALHQVDRTKKYISGARKFLGEGKIGLAIERYDIAEDALESANYYRELLWKLSDDDPTQEEFEAICVVESMKIVLYKLAKDLSGK